MSFSTHSFPSNRKPRIGSTIRFRAVAAMAAVALILIILGCMSFSIGGKTMILGPEGNPFEQSGAIELRPGAEQDVYYAIPYASTPNLEIDSMFDDVELVEQHADHFRVRNTSNGLLSRTVEWKARGVKVPPPGPITVTPLSPTPVAPSNPPPPPAPVPYTPEH
jgi:hypothetical protein